MTRDDLYGHYRKFYVPSNATLLIVGDVDTDDVLKKVEKQFGGIAAGSRPARTRQSEPEQQAERRVTLRKEGTTAYWKAVFHAPAFEHDDFFPRCRRRRVDGAAASTSGRWAASRVAAQRAALPGARRDTGLASTVSGALMRPSIRSCIRVNASVRRRPELSASRAW